MLGRERLEGSTGSLELGTQDKINSIKMHMAVMQMVWEVTMGLMLDMVDIICHRIKETTTRCITNNIQIMISRVDTMDRGFKIEAVVEDVDTTMQVALGAVIIR